MGQLDLNGFLQAGGDGCGCASGSGPMERLGLLCGNGVFQTIVESPSPIRIMTSGLLGDEFVDIGLLSDLEAIEFLYLKSDAPFVVRVGAEEAEIQGTGVPGSVTSTGVETFSVTIDGVLVTWAPGAGSYTIAQVLAAINAAAAAASLPTPRIVYENGRYVVSSAEVGPDATLAIGIGLLNAQLGFSDGATDQGAGEDVTFQGTFLVEFRRNPNAPARIQVSGSGNLKVIAAGRSSL